MHTIEADYLVVGAGAMAMAFIDALVFEAEARVVVVDRNHAPGGHWTMAYPFVRLHQPSAFYGVNSVRLGEDTIDQVGWNQGLYELAGAGEICAYYDHIMRRRLLPTGRVSYFPMSEYLGDGRFRTLAGADYTVHVARRVVDATYMRVTVPAMRPPPYRVSPGIDCVPPGDLPRRVAYERYVIVGAGKTGIDTCLWLLGHGVEPDRLTWIMPATPGCWTARPCSPARYSPRRSRPVSPRNCAPSTTRRRCRTFRAPRGGRAAAADRSGDPPRHVPLRHRHPARTRAAATNHRHRADGASAGHRGRHDGPRRGSIAVSGRELYLDCTADGAEKRPATPIFEGGRITLQSVRGCQQIFSAALIAHVEAAYGEDALRNELCVPLPHPDTDVDWLRLALADYGNQLRWFDDPDLMAWLSTARLDLFGHLIGHLLPSGSAKPRVRDRILSIAKSVFSATAAKLEQLMAAEAALAAR